MSDKNLRFLKELSTTLTNQERSLSKKHLIAFESYHTRSESQMLRLYKEILRRPEIEFHKLKAKISPDSEEKSFNQLIKRTLERVLESLILDINILRGDVYSPVFQKRFKIRKQIMQASIIQGRGLTNHSLKTFNSIIRTARKYELYDELIETLYLKQAVVFNRYGREAYEEIANQIALFEKCRDYLRISKDLYRSYYAKASFQVRSQDSIKKFENRIDDLVRINKELKSANINLYTYPLLMELATIHEDYDEGLRIGLEFIQLLKNNPAIYSKARIGIYYANIADNELSAYRFQSSTKFSKLSIDYLKDRSTVNNLIAFEFLILGNYFSGEIYRTIKIIDDILSTSIVQKYKLYKTKFFYYKAMCYFINKDFKQANLLLSNLSEIEKDKEGWNVWIRIMRILCNIEMLKLNMIDYDVESFRKYLERTDKKYQVSGRDKEILKIIIALDKANYDYRSFSKTYDLNVLLTKGLFWKPKSPELIIFDKWLYSKIKDIDYIELFEELINRNYSEFKEEPQEIKSKPSDFQDTQLSIEF